MQHRQVQGYSSRPSLLHNASPPARTCRCRLFIGFCSILSHLSVFLFIMIYLSVCSDVLHDHAVSSLGSVEFNIRVDVCKKSRIRKILQKRQREYLLLFYVCKKVQLILVFETLRHSVDDNLSTSQSTADLGHIVPKLFI